MAVIGGPHVMTCDTAPLHGRGVSFAQAEAELVWPEILKDADDGELKSVYGGEQRWQQELEAPEVIPPSPGTSEAKVHWRESFLKNSKSLVNSAVFDVVTSNHHHQQKGISSECQDTPATGQPQEPNRTPARQETAR
jgi:hypothetical protein